MTRYKLTVEYNGTAFHGWQEQNGLKSIQSTIQNAIMQFSGEKIIIYGAGRTDAGVHAIGQIAHFDLIKSMTAKSLLSALNHFLQHDMISITTLEEVDDNFHARFSAKSRSYIYKIFNRNAPLTIDKNYAWHIKENLDIQLMQEASDCLIGTHDFASFRSSRCQAQTSIKSINTIRFSHLDSRIEMFINAKSFLHNQVRIIIGTLRKIGNHTWHPSKVQEVLKAKNRCTAGQTAPPHGLYLHSVEY